MGVTMFEKEAEEYCLKRTGYGRDEFHGRKLQQAYKDGAEFGYNKALEELKELKEDRDYFSDALDKQVEATLKLHEKYQELEAQNYLPEE